MEGACNLCDHVDEAKLIFAALTEWSTRQIAESLETTGLHQNSKAAQDGGRIARRVRISLEEKVVFKGELPASRASVATSLHEE